MNKLAGLALAICIAAPSFATTVVRISGPGDFFESGDSSEWTAQSWTQAATYTNVTIRATVSDETISPGGSGTFVLEKRMGGNLVVVDSLDFTFPHNQTSMLIFSGLTLDAGKYFLGLFGAGFWFAEPDGFQTITTAADVTNVTDTLISTNHGNSFQDTNNGIFQIFNVEGTFMEPETATYQTVGGAGLVLVWLKWRMRERSRRS